MSITFQASVAVLVAVVWFQWPLIENKFGALYHWASAELADYIYQASAFIFLAIFWVLTSSFLAACKQCLFVTYRFDMHPEFTLGGCWLESVLKAPRPRRGTRADRRRAFGSS